MRGVVPAVIEQRSSAPAGDVERAIAREWGHDTAEQLLHRGARARGGLTARVGVRVTRSRARFNRRASARAEELGDEFIPGLLDRVMSDETGDREKK